MRPSAGVWISIVIPRSKAWPAIKPVWRNLARDTPLRWSMVDDLPLRQAWFGKAFDLAATSRLRFRDIARKGVLKSTRRHSRRGDGIGPGAPTSSQNRTRARPASTFCDHPGEVDATNNGSERKLRLRDPAKITNGYRAMWAAQAEADVRTTVDTARLKGANPFQTILEIVA